jgi:DNA-binding NtrC family response regulator
MKEHGGAVTIESAVGHGTTCHLVIPVGPREDDQPASEVETPRGEGRILVIDDDEIVRLTVSRRLTMLGYEVVTASDGVEGVAVYRELGVTIRLVIVDIMMPKMGGAETIQAIRSIDPDARILVASGFAPDDAVQALVRELSIEFLQKPFRMAELATAVSAALSGRNEKPAD